MNRPNRLGLRLVSLALCLVSLIGLVRSVSAVSQEPSPCFKTTLVHNSPYASATVIGQMEDGTEVTVLDEYNGFYKVDCYDMTGYIATSQMKHTEDGKYYINCKTKSAETKTMTYTDRSEAMDLRHSLLTLAKEQLGKPYIYGSTGPYGFDCSGLMYYLYGSHDVQLHRTASTQLQDGIIVAKEGLQVGDLIFFRETWEYYPASHVGIYAGNNRIIHASRSRGIEYADLDFDYFDKYYLCARRIIHTNTAKLAQEETDIQQVISRTGISGRQVR